MESVATNHGFTDGNKRTAIILTELLLEQSGYALRPINRSENLDEAVEELVVAIVNHDYSFDELLAWYEARIRKAPDEA